MVSSAVPLRILGILSLCIHLVTYAQATEIRNGPQVSSEPVPLERVIDVAAAQRAGQREHSFPFARFLIFALDSADRRGEKAPCESAASAGLGVTLRERQ